MTVFSHEPTYQQFAAVITEVEQDGCTLQEADQRLQNEFPPYAAARARYGPDNHPLSEEGLQDALARVRDSGSARAVASNLACFPMPPRDIFPLLPNSPGPSAFFHRGRKVMIENLNHGGEPVFGIFRDTCRPCLSEPSEGRRDRCGLKSCSDPPPQRWMEIAQLFLRLYLACLKHMKINVVAHWTNGRWPAMEAGVNERYVALDLSQLRKDGPITGLPTYVGFHPRYLYGSPHLSVRSLALLCESVQLRDLQGSLGVALSSLHDIFETFAFLLSADPPQPLAQEITIMGFQTLMDLLGLDDNTADEDVYTAAMYALRLYLDTFGAFGPYAGPPCVFAPGTYPTLRDVRHALKLRGIEVEKLTPSQVRSLGGKVFGVEGARTYLSQLGYNVLDMSVEELNATKMLEVKRTALIRNAKLREAESFTDDEVHRHFNASIQVMRLLKAGFSPEEIRAMSSEELCRAGTLAMCREHLRNADHATVDQYTDEQVRSESARLVNITRARREAARRAADPDYAAAASATYIQQRRSDLLQKADASDEWFANAMGLFGPEAVTRAWNLNNTGAYRASDGGPVAHGLDAAIRYVVASLESAGVRWPKAADGNDYKTVELALRKGPRAAKESTRTILFFLRRCGVDRILLSDTQGTARQRHEFAERYAKSPWFQTGWRLDTFRSLEKPAQRWVTMAIESGFFVFLPIGTPPPSPTDPTTDDAAFGVGMEEAEIEELDLL